MGSATDWLTISGGEFYSLAINASRELYTWGYNVYGQLGNGTITEHHEPLQIEASTTWSIISAGYSHALGINASDGLYAWGKNNYGQLADDSLVLEPTESQPRK
ncbi:MAG: hypothetical protein U9O24_07585 [Campylobacterota bacterium]|nr:hypothetical protein [Campylobacterota bacterium]